MIPILFFNAIEFIYQYTVFVFAQTEIDLVSYPEGNLVLPSATGHISGIYPSVGSGSVS
jgi:hypothetical protein